jgi:hypothetical protein
MDEILMREFVAKRKQKLFDEHVSIYETEYKSSLEASSYMTGKNRMTHSDKVNLRDGSMSNV